jgi:transposase
MGIPAIAKVAFTSEDLVRDVIRNFRADGFSSLDAKYKGGRPPKFTQGQRPEIKKIAQSKPAEHGLRLTARRLSKPAESLVAQRVVDDISHEGLRWAAVSGQNADPGRRPRPRMRATCTRTEGVRHLLAACDQDKLYGRVRPRTAWVRFRGFCRYLHSLYLPAVRIAIICNNFSPSLPAAGLY